MEIKPFSEAWADIWNIATGPPSLFKLKLVISPLSATRILKAPSQAIWKPPKILSLRLVFKAGETPKK